MEIGREEILFMAMEMEEAPRCEDKENGKPESKDTIVDLEEELVEHTLGLRGGE